MNTRADLATATPSANVWCEDCSGLRWVHLEQQAVGACGSCNRFAGLRGVEPVDEKAALELHARDCGCEPRRSK